MSAVIMRSLSCGNSFSTFFGAAQKLESHIEKYANCIDLDECCKMRIYTLSFGGGDARLFYCLCGKQQVAAYFAQK